VDWRVTLGAMLTRAQKRQRDQDEEQQQREPQQAGNGNDAATAAASSQLPDTAARKARQMYIGNLAVGIVTPDLLKDSFNRVRSAVCRVPSAGLTCRRGMHRSRCHVWRPLPRCQV
jgi:hypothetical protein